jgi:hypothetical protein
MRVDVFLIYQEKYSAKHIYTYTYIPTPVIYDVIYVSKKTYLSYLHRHSVINGLVAYEITYCKSQGSLSLLCTIPLSGAQETS